MKLRKHQRIKQRSRAKINFERYSNEHNLMFCIRVSYVIKTFLLIKSTVRSKQLLCFVHSQGQNGEQKHATKNFVEFHYHFSLLNMLKSSQGSHELPIIEGIGKTSLSYLKGVFERTSSVLSEFKGPTRQKCSKREKKRGNSQGYLFSQNSCRVLISWRRLSRALKLQ